MHLSAQCSPTTPLQSVTLLMDELCGSGPLGALLRGHLSTGGKRIRARLALSACEALGVPQDDAVCWAAACELLHNASLIFDDIQDGDRYRRGQPALWVRSGQQQAINAGSLAMMLPAAALERMAAPEALRWRLGRALSAAAADMARGQAEEMALVWSERPTWADYTRAVTGKTAALFQLPVEGAALLAGARRDTAARLTAPLRQAGLLFQLQDDLLDLDPDKGRPPGSDLAEGAVSAVVLAHLDHHPADRPALLALLRAPRGAADPAEIVRWRMRLSDAAIVDTVRERIAHLRAEIVADPALSAFPPLRHLVEALLARLLPSPSTRDAR